MLVPTKAVRVRVEDIKDCRKTVQVLAFVTLGTESSCEEKAEERAGCLVCLRPTGVVANVATGWRGGFR